MHTDLKKLYSVSILYLTMKERVVTVRTSVGDARKAKYVVECAVRITIKLGRMLEKLLSVKDK